MEQEPEKPAAPIPMPQIEINGNHYWFHGIRLQQLSGPSDGESFYLVSDIGTDGTQAYFVSDTRQGKYLQLMARKQHLAAVQALIDELEAKDDAAEFGSAGGVPNDQGPEVRPVGDA